MRSDPRYRRADFSGDICEKAYLVGFRLGDLHVALEVVARSSSSARAPGANKSIFRLLFEPYGHVYTDEATVAQRQRQSIGMAVAASIMTFELPVAETRFGAGLGSRQRRAVLCVPGGVRRCRGLFSHVLERGQPNCPWHVLKCAPTTRRFLAQLRTVASVARKIACPPARLTRPAGYTNEYGVRSNQRSVGTRRSSQSKSLRLLEQSTPTCGTRSDVAICLRVMDGHFRCYTLVFYASLVARYV